MNSLLSKASKIKLLILDVDGVLTDGKIYFADDGSEMKSFFSRDGVGIKLLLKAGIDVGIITGRSSKALEYRMNGLGVRHIFQNQEHKMPAFITLRDSLGLSNEQIAYVGDDSPDMPVMREVGLSIAVHDAHDEVRGEADYVTTLSGGIGAVREVCDLILKARTFE